MSLHLDFEWAPGIEGPALGRAEGDLGKPGFALVGPAGAFGAVHGVIPHLAYGKTALGHWTPEMAANLFPVKLNLIGCCAGLLIEA